MTRALRFKDWNPSCSNCNAPRRLHLVTCAGPGADEPGRLLVYCPSCRQDKAHMLDVSIPLELVSRELLLALYMTGKTESDPAMVVDHILGLSDSTIVADLEAALAARAGTQAGAPPKKSMELP